MKKIIIISLLLIFKMTAYSQKSKPVIYNAYQLQTIDDSSGTSKGWHKCDFDIKFYTTNKKFDSIIIDANNHVGMLIKELKASYKIDDITFAIYTGYDDLTGEDLEIKFAKFDKQIINQTAELYVKYTLSSFTVRLSNKQ